MNITKIHAREILDSRGNPTLEAEVTLATGHTGRAAVPSGASTGSREAVELRDGDKTRYLGKGVTQGRRQRQRRPSPAALEGFDAADQERTRSPSSSTSTVHRTRVSLGANALLGVSLANAHAAAAARGLPLWKHLAARARGALPVPMMNIINGGAHADNNVDIQEFMVLPVGCAELLRSAALRHRNLPRAQIRAEEPRPDRPRSATKAVSRRT